MLVVSPAVSPTDHQTTDGPPALRVRGLHKRFGPLTVLRGVDLELYPGEILALVGENGAGKSTVVRCIAQTNPGDAGRVELLGRTLAADPVGARDQGIAVVWQDLALCDNLSVVANLFLGGEHLRRRLLDDRSMVDEAMTLFARLDLASIDLHRPLGTLSGGQRQLVAIARAVRRNPAVLILDEPTASLGVTETAPGRAAAGRPARCGHGHPVGLAPARAGVRAGRPHRRAARRAHHRQCLAAARSTPTTSWR